MTIQWCKVTGKGDVTQEVLELAESIEAAFYQDQPIDWQDFLDRIDGTRLDDGSTIDLGTELSSPAILHIKSHIRRHRRK